MLEFKLDNEEVVQRKARRILKLKKEKTKNQAKYTEAFENLLRNKSLAAVLALLEDEFVVKNDFSNKKIKLDRIYGIKGGKFVNFFPEANKNTNNEDFEENVNSDNVKLRSRSIKPGNFVVELMKYSLDLEPIYDAWVSQLIEVGNELMSNPELLEDDSDEDIDLDEEEDDEDEDLDDSMLEEDSNDSILEDDSDDSDDSEDSE